MRKVILFLFVAAGAAFFFSCASGPSAETVTLEAAQDRAQAAMEKAKSVKADVAVKTDFAGAMTVYDEAKAASGDAAIPKYLEAEGRFLAAHDLAVTKREEANKQLNKARSDIKAVEDEAEMLQKEQQGGAQ